MVQTGKWKKNIDKPHPQNICSHSDECFYNRHNIDGKKNLGKMLQQF